MRWLQFASISAYRTPLSVESNDTDLLVVKYLHVSNHCRIRNVHSHTAKRNNN